MDVSDGPGQAETAVGLLITQRRLAAPRRASTWPERGRNRQSKTGQRRITRGPRPGSECATSTDSTDHRTDGTRCAGIIRPAVPRPVPRPECWALDNLLAGYAPTSQLQEVRSRA